MAEVVMASARGWREDDVYIGDVWAWGEVRLQVAQPRFPCYKLAMATERPHIAKPFLAHGRTGWYLRVLDPGEAPIAGPIAVVERDPRAVTVLDAHRALVSDATPAEIARVLAVPALATSWRAALGDRR